MFAINIANFLPASAWQGLWYTCANLIFWKCMTSVSNPTRTLCWFFWEFYLLRFCFFSSFFCLPIWRRFFFSLLQMLTTKCKHLQCKQLPAKGKFLSRKKTSPLHTDDWWQVQAGRHLRGIRPVGGFGPWSTTWGSPRVSVSTGGGGKQIDHPALISISPAPHQSTHHSWEE